MKPFLKWAGNKYQIIERIKQVLPEGNRLIEPFLGSAAVFLNTEYNEYTLADTNKDLINLYKQIQIEGLRFIKYAKSFFNPKNNIDDRFYELRLEFNTIKNIRRKSALFIYLNKHCYNGLCRYNLKGEFNTPFGKYKKPYFPENELKYFYNKSLCANFLVQSFDITMNNARKGDVIYCDPPYVPLSATSNFTSYSTGGFSIEQQFQLARLAEKISKKGIPVIISNHATEFIYQEYRKAKIFSFDVQRFISTNGNNRDKALEVLGIFRGN